MKRILPFVLLAACGCPPLLPGPSDPCEGAFARLRQMDCPVPATCPRHPECVRVACDCAEAERVGRKGCEELPGKGENKKGHR